MEQFQMYILRIVLCYSLLFTVSVTRADNTGKLQFLYTAYLDIPALFPKTLASCKKFDASTEPELQRLYDLWYQQHGRYQKELQQLIFKYFSKQMGGAKTRKVIAEIKKEVKGELVSLSFPQNHTWTDNWFCTKLLPEDLTGKGLMLNYADYVEELKQNLAQFKQQPE
ncbi:hypothetical protein ACG9YX_19200 [Acinetobacter nematophilus]|uniref:hypothetical protein n=1 Tax=Acinetobacter nematophilus TaxID=2994642 RepID=UPI003AF5391E